MRDLNKPLAPTFGGGKKIAKKAVKKEVKKAIKATKKGAPTHKVLDDLGHRKGYRSEEVTGYLSSKTYKKKIQKHRKSGFKTERKQMLKDKTVRNRMVGTEKPSKDSWGDTVYNGETHTKKTATKNLKDRYGRKQYTQSKKKGKKSNAAFVKKRMEENKRLKNK